MLRVESALLANSAQLDGNGLISILGGFVNNVTGPQLPIRHMVTLVARLEVDMDETEIPHPIAIVVESQDGTEQVARIDIVLPPGEREAIDALDPNMPIHAPIVLPLPLEFRQEGIYDVKIMVDDQMQLSLPLRIRTTAPQL